MYEIYRNKQWAGDLDKLIGSFNNTFHNSSLPPQFGQARLNCGQKCMLEQCDLCKRMKELSDKFVKDNVQILKKKDKGWKNETKSYKEAMQLVEKAATNSDDKISQE